MRTLLKFRFLLICLYAVYAVSPLAADTGDSSASGLAADRAEPAIKILLWERFIAAIVQPGDAEEATDSADVSDVMVKRLRTITTGHSLGKRMFIETHTSAPVDVSLDERSGRTHASFSPDLSNDHSPTPSQGFGRHHSGLAPPSLLS